MDFELLKAGVREIATISEDVPERFRDKCFELLLSSLVEGLSTGSGADKNEERKPPQDGGEQPANKTSKIPVKTQVRLLMLRTGVTLDEIEKIVLFENDEVHFVREPQDVAVAQGQIEWALLLALKSGILKDSLSADPEDVRSICQDKGFYDTKNFASNFKNARNANLFKGLMAPQGGPQSLTPDGQDALGRLIKRLATEPS